MSLPHGSTCGCGFCVSLVRLGQFVTHPDRDPRLSFVAGLRLRILYTQLIDVSEGLLGAPELAGCPYITDPSRLPAAAVSPPVRETSVAPGGPPKVEEILATTAKAKAVAPKEVKGSAPEDTPPGEEESLPRTGEERKESHRERPSTSAPRSHRDRPEERKPGKREVSRKASRSRRRRSSSSKEKRRQPKKDRKSRSRRRRRDSSERRRRTERPRTPVRKRETEEKSEPARVKKERSLSEDRRPVAEVEPRVSRDEGRGEEAGRERSLRPRPPDGPPPQRGWSGPIPAHRRGGWDYVEPRGEEWPKSKGVKRREKNRAFREANYPRDWGRGGYR